MTSTKSSSKEELFLFEGRDKTFLDKPERKKRNKIAFGCIVFKLYQIAKGNLLVTSTKSSSKEELFLFEGRDKTFLDKPERKKRNKIAFGCTVFKLNWISINLLALNVYNCKLFKAIQ